MALNRDYWPAVYRYVLRRRFDRACLLLQRLLDDPLTRARNLHPIHLLASLLLSYPTAKQRSSNPYALGHWHLELQARLRGEDVGAWEQGLANVLTLVEGQAVPPSIRAGIGSWQEMFVGQVGLAAQQMPLEELVRRMRDCIAEKPSPSPVMDQLTLGLFQGSPEFERLADIPMLGPHLVDLLASLSPALAEQRSPVLIAYGRQLISSCSLWNLGADYLWTASEAGRQELERQLFDMARTASPSKQRCIVDLCRNFDMNILADAILVMISESALRAGALAKALAMAIEAGQPSLITRVCDAVLGQVWTADSLEVIDGAALDCSMHPRLALLVALAHMQRCLEAKDEEGALKTLVSSILPFEQAIPEFIRPRLLTLYLRLAPSLPAGHAPPLTVLLEFVNSHAAGMPAEAALELRRLLVHQAASTFLSH